MKAYVLSLKNDDEGFSEIVFAETSKAAKKMIYRTNLGDMVEEWIDIRVHRDKRYDGMENLSDAELALKQWRDGWGWIDMDPPDADEATDEEFFEWHKKWFGPSEKA